MRLNRIESLAMNNPIRRLSQKYIEFGIFKKHLKNQGVDLANKALLDAGCGSGYSTELIYREFEPSRLEAVDLMPEQIELARERRIPNASFAVGDLTQMTFLEGSFDGVFVFGVIHHIPDWKKALREISRVLRPQGVLLVEELNKGIVDAVGNIGFEHSQEARFDWPEFKSALQEVGFSILAEHAIVLPGIRSFLARKN